MVTWLAIPADLQGPLEHTVRVKKAAPPLSSEVFLRNMWQM